MSKNKQNLHAFRADDELTDLLVTEPNKSEIIVQALREYYRREHAVVCPMCAGKGVVYQPPNPKVILRKRNK